MNFKYRNFNINYIKELFSFELISISKNEYLFQEEMKNEFVYFINEGKLKVIKNEMVIGFTKENEFVGITSCLSENTHYCFSVVACADSILCKIPKTIFKQSLINNPEFGKTIIDLLCKRIKIIDNKTESIKNHTTSELIVNEILNNSQYEENSRKVAQLTNEDLVELTRIPLVKIQSKLKELNNLKLINYSTNQIEILNINELKKLGRL
jgi:CRP-like cAMP-binding protein